MVVDYIYLICGMYYMLYIANKKNNKPEAVLIRGVEPINNDLINTNGPENYAGFNDYKT